MSDLKVPIGTTDAAAANAVLSAAQSSPSGIDPPVLELGLEPSYQLDYASFPTAGSTSWTSPTPIALPYGTPPAGVSALRIWTLPESLIEVAQAPTATTPQPPLPCFGLELSSVDEATGATTTGEAPSYGWATQIGVTVKRLATPSTTPTGVNTYELVGANEYDVVLLERFLTAVGLDPSGVDVDQLLLLHAASGGTPGLASDGTGVMTFISQANLSTVTRPPSRLSRSLEAPVADAAQTTVDFVRLLWECSITRSGGFYLYYCTDPVRHTGLPDAIFNDRGEAVLTLLLLHGAPSDPTQRNRLPGYVNAAVTAGFVDPASTAVAARARPLPAFTTAAAQSLNDLSATYHASARELATANADVALAAAVTVAGGRYQVRPSSPGQDPTAIASWFGTTVAALQAANPGVDLSQSQALWSRLTLPTATVAAGTAGRTTLVAIADYYGATVDALADANGAQAGLFSGRQVSVPELVTATPSDTLAGLGAGFYLDPVQLAEDNADVPLVSGAQLTVSGGLYEVPATAGAGALATIAARFAADPAAIQAANPDLSWSAPQPPLTLVALPPTLTVRVGTSPSAGTLGQIADFYGVRLARIALDNATTPGLFGVPLRVRGGPLSRQAASPAGTVTYGLTRTAAPPPTDTSPEAVLERLYNLLSYRVPTGLPGFAATTPGPPLGPLTAPPGPGGDRMRQPDDDGIWRYQKAVPYSRLVTPPTRSGTGPDPALSPYLGVGGLLRLELAWNDLFGNAGLTPLAQPALDPAAPLNLPPARALYTDPIVGLSEWPSVGFDYTVVAAGAGQATLEIALAFDGCTYLVDGEQSCARPANPPKVDPAERAARDAAVYARIWFQLATAAGGGLTVDVDTSLLPGTPQTVDPAPLEAFVAAVYAWLEARAAGTTNAPFPTVAPIAVPLDLSKLAGDQIFELSVALNLRRPAALVDPDLLVESRTAANATTIPPHQSQEAAGQPFTLAAFATSFEQAMTVAGSWRLKLAVGVDRDRAERAGAGAPLWAVRLGLGAGQPLAYAVDGPTAPTTYAPRPVSNVPRSGPVSIVGYVTGSGLTGPSSTQSFSGIDLDRWTADVLAAIDGLLSPTYASAIGLIDSRLPSGRTPHLQELATAKQALASALQQLVIPVLPGAVGADPVAAQETFGQQLLVQLGSFYTTDAIVQFPVTASSQATDVATAPQLFGGLEQTGATPAPVTLTDPKVSLAQPASGPPPTLTFLLSTAAGQVDVAHDEAQISLQLDYVGTDIEHQIGTLPGIAGYRPSSWLSFVRDESPWPLTAELGPFEVPLVLRGFPTPPTMRSQSGTQTVPDGTAGLRLGQTLGWDYELVYSEAYHYQQDTVHLTIEFNHVETATAPRTPLTAAGTSDPFVALAQFVSVIPQIQEDIDRYVVPVDPSTIDPSSPAYAGADAALSSVTQMAGTVAGALGGGIAEHGFGTPLPVERYELAVVEGEVELTSRRDPQKTITALLVTVEDVPAALAASVTVDVGVDDRYTAQAPPDGGAAEGAAGDGPDAAGDPATFAYVYVDTTTGEWLAASDGASVGPRKLTVPGLDILARQDAWASAWVGRNENAVKPFQYQTPTVFFASPQYPTNRYTAPPTIEVAAIGTGTPQTRSPQLHLAALFAALFANAPKGEQTIQLECRYAYELSGAALLPIELPVYLLPPTTADPAVDLVIPGGGCPTDPTAGPLVCRLAAALSGWWQANAPSDTSGAFVLDLTVMSSLTSQPLIALSNLELSERWIDWS